MQGESVTSNKPLLTPTKYPYFIQAPPSRKRKCGVYVKSLEAKDNGIWKLTINLHPRGQIIRTVDLGSRYHIVSFYVPNISDH